MNFDYKGQSEQELLNLVDEKKLNSGKCEWKYWTSEIYSFGKYMRKYGFFPSFLPLYVYNEHGVTISEDFEIPPHELENDAYCMFYMNPNKVSTYRQKSKKKCYPIKSLSVVGRHFLKIEKKKNARGTLFFFSHSTPSIENKMDVTELCEQLLSLPSEYQPVCVCMHMHDINKGYHKYFFEKNIPVYTAGNTLDVDFCERYYKLLENFNYSASNVIGSYTFYSIEMKIPFFFYGNEPEYYNFLDANIPKRIYDVNEKDFYREIVKLFRYDLNKGLKINITLDQKKLTAQKLGLNSGISRLQMCRILWKAYFANENILGLLKRFMKQISVLQRIYDKIVQIISNISKYQTTDELMNIVFKYYENNESYKESIAFFKKYGFSTFPFFWTREYDDVDIEVFNDDGFPYVIHKQKKLFFPKNMSENIVKEKYKALLIEQDNRSSHAYFSETFKLTKDCIFFDVGCAEAIITLENIDVIKKAYLFECDNLWIDALNKTFQPYREKIRIVCKYISDKNSKNFVTLDKITEEIDVSENIFIKADIEGFESKLLKGSKETFKKFSNIKLSICTYHNLKDKEKFSKILGKEFIIEYSNSYMIWPWLSPKYKLQPPYFTSGIIRASKK